MQKLFYVFFVLLLTSCNNGEVNSKEQPKPEKENSTEKEDLPPAPLPKPKVDAKVDQKMETSVSQGVITKEFILRNNLLGSKYRLDYRMKPEAYEVDLNGGGTPDFVIQILEVSTGKKGFAVFHAEDKKIHIIGAGTTLEGDLSDNLEYINKWGINRKRKNEPGIDQTKPLILKYPSIEIIKTESGGGQVYWNGKRYAYFHQSC
jgi:hypothetical protein